MLLREYLVVRGAIRVSRKNERFQLSDDLDERTRTRIVQIMEAMEAEELLTPAATLAAPTALRGFKPNQGAIASSSVSRQVKRWQFRGSLAALSILLTIGAVWLVTENTSNHVAAIQSAQQPSLNSGAAPIAQPMQEAGISGANELNSIASIGNGSIGKMHAAILPHTSKNVITQASNPITQNASQSHDPKVAEPASATQATDPAADMISHRYTKAIGDAKNEVVVSGHDRL